MSASASVNKLTPRVEPVWISPETISGYQERIKKEARKIFEKIPLRGEHPNFKCAITMAIMTDPVTWGVVIHSNLR